MTFTFGTPLTSLTHLVDTLISFETLGCNTCSFQKINDFHFFHTKAYLTKFDLSVILFRVNGLTTDGRRKTEPAFTISSPDPSTQKTYKSEDQWACRSPASNRP